MKPALNTPAPGQHSTVEQAANSLLEFLQHHAPVMVLTGAGISTDSGIPDYRDGDGAWKRRQPIQHQQFMQDFAARQRYWARSLVGWPVMQQAQPNRAHHALVCLQRSGAISAIVTQNVDRLHQRAGSHDAVDLHGRADQMICMSCGDIGHRAHYHERCREANPQYLHLRAAAAPDGDADLEADFSRFVVPECRLCGGILKPDVVFFGDNVPRERVQTVADQLDASGALLVIGSSLMVYSGFRFCRQANEQGKAIALLTLGRTRADELAQLKWSLPVGDVMDSALSRHQGTS